MANKWYKDGTQEPDVDGRKAAARAFVKAVYDSGDLRKKVIGFSEQNFKDAWDKFKTLGDVVDLPSDVKVICVFDNFEPKQPSMANLVVFAIPDEGSGDPDGWEKMVCCWQPYKPGKAAKKPSDETSINPK